VTFSQIMDVNIESSSISQCLNFDDMSWDDEEDDTSQSDTCAALESSNNSARRLPRRTKLDFNFKDNLDLQSDNEEDEYKENLNERLSLTPLRMPQSKKLRFNMNSSGDSFSLPTTPNTSSTDFSPCRTRSGRIYTSGLIHLEKTPQSCQMESSCSDDQATAEDKSLGSNEILHKESELMPEPRKRPTPKFILPRSKELNLLQKDKFDQLTSMPPPLNYNKRPVSRLSGNHPRYFDSEGPHSDPITPPTDGVKAMKLFDDCQLITSPVSAPKIRSRIFSNFGSDEKRRVSAPAPVSNILAYKPESSIEHLRKRKRATNINPFTPTSLMQTLRKKARMASGESATESNNGSFEADLQNFSALATPVIDNETIDETVVALDTIEPPKRLKVSDINISRYDEEFVEIREIASGNFGTVKYVRHRLDGMVYAVKITRNKIYGNSHEEKVAMNEVFAHSALIRHKHVVRYYNSWVENGRVYIQNEYCEGGSLSAKIQELRSSGKHFSEAELKRILLHLAKGLDYIHSKLLVHLDVKPENIFISLDYPVRIDEHSNPSSPVENPIKISTNNEIPKKGATSTEEELFSGESTDSGLQLGTGKKSYQIDSNSSSPLDDRVAYKIGDLGHVVSIHGDSVPEEGDCRYMAPELFSLTELNRENLGKADIFSLGLTLFEAASLKKLPKNSLDDSEDLTYEDLKSGHLPYLKGYSKGFNDLLKAMVNQDPILRPSAYKLANNPCLRGKYSSNNKSRSQLYQELNDTKAKLARLEAQLGTSASDTPKSTGSFKNSRLIGRGCVKSRSSNSFLTNATPSKW